MKTQSASSIHFQRKISDYCNLRIAPLVSKRSLENVKPYLSSLIIYRKARPTRSGRVDWHSFGAACGLGEELSAKLKDQIRPALEAIERWIEHERSSDDDCPRPDYEDTDDARLRAPRTLDSLNVLSSIEKRYRLPTGYFKAKLPHQSRSAYGHEVGGDISASERRRLAWHLPGDFNTLPFEKREEILEWVRRVIISGSTDYRRFQATASKQRYAIRFPSISYGGALSPRLAAIDGSYEDSSDGGEIEDPDLLAGVVDAPSRLSMEMASLVHFKTATLTAVGFQRNGVWGDETTSQKIEHLGLMFGSLAASPKGTVKGYGVPLAQLTFGLLVYPGVWDWYLQWRERRRGFYTKWEEDMLQVLLGMVRPETGWMWQHPELCGNIRPIPGLVSASEIKMAQANWDAACEAIFKHASQRMKEIQRVAHIHRDPFEPIMCVLEADSPLAESPA